MPAPRRASARTNTAANPAADGKAAAPGHKTTGKRTREPVDATLESGPTPAKKAKALTSKPTPEAEVRRSARGRKPTTKAAPHKRVRRTPDEIEAAKAAVEEAKKQKVANAEEAQRRLAQMDIDDDADRARSAANTIRRLSDIAAESDGEEFVGFNEVSSSSSSSDGSEPEDIQVSLLLRAGNCANTYYHGIL